MTTDQPRQATDTLFSVENLHARPADSDHGDILRGFDLQVEPGSIHAIIGPNGSGASMLGAVFMGSSEYEVTEGTVTFHGDDITEWPVDERAKAGMFLGFGCPQEIPGVSVIQFLRRARSARTGSDLSVSELRDATIDWAKRLGMDADFVDRHLDEGCSSSEMRCNEIVQMAILEPELAILDEIDPGPDIDAMRIVVTGIRAVRSERESMGVVLVTRDPRLLDELEPDRIHVLVDGRIVTSGGMELAEQFERDGDQSLRTVGV